MKDLGIKVVKLNLRVNKLISILNLKQIQFTPRFSSNYENLLINQLNQLYIRVKRLEKFLNINTRKINKNIMKNNVAIKINMLCVRISNIEKIFL